MTKAAYKEMSLDGIVEYINHLPSRERLRIVSKVTYNLSKEKMGKRLDIRKLRGLGKEIWQGIDAQEYVDKERESWHN